MSTVNDKPYNNVDRLLAWTNEELEHDEVIEMFQYLIDTGMAWKLEGHIGRTAARLIEAGECHA
jgi:hypothetical protein